LIEKYSEEIRKFFDKYHDDFEGNINIEDFLVIEATGDIKDYLKISKSRLRNLKVKLFNYRKNYELDSFTFEELQKSLYFKISDIIFYADSLFEKNEDEFKIKDEILTEINKYKRKQEDLSDNIEKMEENFKSDYRYLNKNLSNLDRVNDWEEKVEKMKTLAIELHWKYMPIYEEYMLENRDIIPEDEPEKYYNHYHSLEDLYRAMIGKGLDWKSAEGDCNLDKELIFEVFTSRWGHKDRYRMQRTIYGWYVTHISINGSSQKDGTGALFSNFRQDGVFYPVDGVKHALETLWNDADSSEMSVEELQDRLQEVADWVSEVEKVTTNEQPSWVNYY
jgi:hypothetical protein